MTLFDPPPPTDDRGRCHVIDAKLLVRCEEHAGHEGPHRYNASLNNARRSADRRDEAVARVEANTEPEWGETARQFLIEYARTHPEFASDALWDAGLVKPHTGQALGPVMTWGKDHGIIEATGAFRPTTLVSSHGMPKRIWRSLIFEEVDAS